MAISFAEHVALTCPRCQTTFTNETYVVVDGTERPDLVARILDDTLHDTICPHCTQPGRVPAPLLYHDGVHQRVLLGVPPDMPEMAWREVGQNLLWTLIGQLPETARLPYLGEVQAEAGLAGVAQIIRAEGLAGSGVDDDAELPPIVVAIQALLAAQGAAELQRVVDQHAILGDPQAVTILRELAAEAIKQNQPEAADAFARAAEILDRVKQLRGQNDQPAENDHLMPEHVEELAFRLLRSTSGHELAHAVDQHPELLDDEVLAALAAWGEEQQRQNKPRIAEGMRERLTALHDMRAQYHAQQPVLDVVQAYLQAETNEEIEAIIVENDLLTTDQADQTLARLADAARTDGDAPFAAFVDERRTFLQQVRAALEQ